MNDETYSDGLLTKLAKANERIAALEARLRNAWIVPPLVWVGSVGATTGNKYWDAVAGAYVLQVQADSQESRWAVFAKEFIAGGKADTPELAKAAAEAAYIKHITAGLQPAWGEEQHGHV